MVTAFPETKLVQSPFFQGNLNNSPVIITPSDDLHSLDEIHIDTALNVHLFVFKNILNGQVLDWNQTYHRSTQVTLKNISDRPLGLALDKYSPSTRIAPQSQHIFRYNMGGQIVLSRA